MDAISTGSRVQAPSQQIQRAPLTDVALGLQAAMLAQPDFAQAAVTYATQLAQALKCERVSVGLVESKGIRLVAQSHGAALDTHQDLNRALADAMNEAVDQAATLSLPASGGFPRITQAHAALWRISGGALCTIPIAEQGKVTAAVTLQRDAHEAIDADEMTQWEHLVRLTGAVLTLKAKGDASWFERARIALAMQWARLTQPGEAAFKWVVAGVVVFAAVMLLVPVPYSVSAPAKLEGALQRVLVAASDGFIQQTSVRPGDRVKEGQLLAELVQHDLQLERSKRESEFSQHASTYSAAFARADRASLMVSQAKMNEARAQLDLVEKQLERTQIRAPFDGVIISGDLTQTLGAPVQRGAVLMTLAPAERYRLIIEVDERDVRDVVPGAAGRVALAAMPQSPLAFRVERVTPLSATREGRHFFDVEGMIDAPNTANATLRPGLQGVARIDAESRPLAAMMLGRLTNWLRLRLWTWGWLQ